MDAEGAFIHIAFRMNKPRVVRAGCHTGFASHAFFMIDKDYTAAVVDVTGSTGTAIYARWVLTMITAFAANLHVKRGVESLRVIRDPVAVETLWDLVLGLAGHDAIHAAHAFPGIDDHRVTCHG
jgi:hypothetical protein